MAEKKRGVLLDAMLVFCTTKHAGQFDKGGRPYILHPLTVMHKLHTDDEELQCIALGHDVIEDTDATYQDLRNIGMTERVIVGIRSVTKVPGETYEEYKAKVKANVDGRAVKKVDLRTNSDLRRMKGVTDKDINRTVRYLQFYAELEECDLLPPKS